MNYYDHPTDEETYEIMIETYDFEKAKRLEEFDRRSFWDDVIDGVVKGFVGGYDKGPANMIRGVITGGIGGAAMYGIEHAINYMDLMDRFSQADIRNLSKEALGYLEKQTIQAIAQAKWNEDFKRKNILSSQVKTVPPQAYETKLGLIRSAKTTLEKENPFGSSSTSITTQTDPTFNPDLTDIQFGTDYRTPDFGLMNDEMQISLSNFDAVAQFNSAVDQMQTEGVLSGTPYDYNPDQSAYSVSFDLNTEPANYGYNELIDTNLSQVNVSIDGPYDEGYSQTGGSGASTDDTITDEEMEDYEQMNDDWGYF